MKEIGRLICWRVISAKHLLRGSEAIGCPSLYGRQVRELEQCDRRLQKAMFQSYLYSYNEYKFENYSE